MFTVCPCAVRAFTLLYFPFNFNGGLTVNNGFIAHICIDRPLEIRAVSSSLCIELIKLIRCLCAHACLCAIPEWKPSSIKQYKESSVYIIYSTLRSISHRCIDITDTHVCNRLTIIDWHYIYLHLFIHSFTDYNIRTNPIEMYIFIRMNLYM